MDVHLEIGELDDFHRIERHVGLAVIVFHGIIVEPQALTFPNSSEIECVKTPSPPKFQVVSSNLGIVEDFARIYGAVLSFFVISAGQYIERCRSERCPGATVAAPGVVIVRLEKCLLRAFGGFDESLICKERILDPTDSRESAIFPGILLAEMGGRGEVEPILSTLGDGVDPARVAEDRQDDGELGETPFMEMGELNP